MKPYYQDSMIELYCGNSAQVLKSFQDECVNCCVTSPPYFGLRDYNNEEQIGMEESLDEYISNLINIFSEVHRVLRADGVFWLNIGDSYSKSGKGSDKKYPAREMKKIKQSLPKSIKPKELIGVPWRLAFALQEFGWYLRQDCIWYKKNCMPESVKDRCTRSHEYLFLLSKSKNYYYDYKAIREPCSRSTISDITRRKSLNNKSSGEDDFSSVRPDLCRNRQEYVADDFMRNKRSVWEVNTKPFPDTHFAVFPENLIVPCILAGCHKDGVVLDPFSGSGTTLKVANKFERKSIGIELNEEYCKMAVKRFPQNRLDLW